MQFPSPHQNVTPGLEPSCTPGPNKHNMQLQLFLGLILTDSDVIQRGNVVFHSDHHDAQHGCQCACGTTASWAAGAPTPEPGSSEATVWHSTRFTVLVAGGDRPIELQRVGMGHVCGTFPPHGCAAYRSPHHYAVLWLVLSSSWLCICLQAFACVGGRPGHWMRIVLVLSACVGGRSGLPGLAPSAGSLKGKGAASTLGTLRWVYL